jgi:arabinogalactan endo-1,4-beta-galactosidase
MFYFCLGAKKGHVIDVEFSQFFDQKKSKKDLKKIYNSYWVNAARLLLFDDGISADEEFVVVGRSLCSSFASSCSMFISA